MTTTPPRHRPRAFALALCGLGGLCVGGAWAQDLDGQQPVRVGDAALYPALRIDYLVDDNVGLRSDDEVDGTAVVVSPRLDFVADRRLLELRAFYSGRFSQGSLDPLDYADHTLGIGVDAEFDARRRASVSLAVARNHQDLGLELTRGRADEFDEAVELNDTVFDARFTYGANDARGNLVGGLRLGDVSYTNLSAVTDGLDYTRVEPYAQFGYRLSGATRAVLEVGFGSYDFADGDADRDETNVGAGVRFAPSGKLRGAFLLGVSNADYANDAVDDESAFTASADIDWLVREYATISLDLSRAFDNLSPRATEAGEGQSIRTETRLGWNHSWSDRFATSAFVRLVDVARACPELPTTTGSAGGEFGLSVRRWLTLGASASWVTRTSDDCPNVSGEAEEAFDFDRTVLGAYVRATL